MNTEAGDQEMQDEQADRQLYEGKSDQIYQKDHDAVRRSGRRRTAAYGNAGKGGRGSRPVPQ